MAWDGQTNLLQFGIATSLMVAVLTFFLWVAKGARAQAGKGQEPATTEEPDEA